MLRHLSALLLLAPVALAAAPVTQHPTPETAGWWAETTALSNDAMEGRDTGTEAYERAARYVAAQMRAAGLEPAGDHGSFLQRVPMEEVDLDPARSSVDLLPATAGSASTTPLRLLDEITLSPHAGMPERVEGPVVFCGYGVPAAGPSLQGKVVVYFNNVPAGSTRESFVAERSRALAHSGAVAILAIDNPAATEPSHWPAAYARTVRLRTSAATPGDAPLAMRASEAAAARLFRASGVAPAPIFLRAERGLPLPAVNLAGSLRLHLALTQKSISAPNILAVFPGSDPKLRGEYVALSAHLDGYGFGTPVHGDRIYNGTLDDAAYVATLIELARSVSQMPAARRPRRSLLFCIFTGEEKGLLGSAWFTQHPTVPMAQIVADLNLDQLRPIFPLKILTMEGIADSTLGATARRVASSSHIELRPDREPERNLFRRADNYNFVRAGVPIASFIFGYNEGTPEQRAYRDWYATRYHKPQDDLTTPIDWEAAAKLNRFFSDLALAVADAPDRPQWSPASPYAPASLPARPGARLQKQTGAAPTGR